MRIIIWGVGDFACKICSNMKVNSVNVEIVGFCDNNSDKWGEFYGKKVYAPYELSRVNYDKIIILSNLYYDEIRKDIMYWFKIPKQKIGNVNDLLRILVLDKYRESDDRELQEIVHYLETHQLSIFNQYVQDEGYALVQWDNMENMPFIMIEDKKMYYPYDTVFEEYEGKKIVRNVMQEQQSTSPHLYIKDDICVEKGDIIADVGVAEGDFSIRFIDKASKIYLFEGDKKWKKPLEKTFEKFKDKIVFIDKYIGQRTENNQVCLDDIIHESINFLKMDIEGEECKALLGAKKLLNRSNAKCAICSYHRYGDEETIKNILNIYGYCTSVSDGYMFFYHDINIFSTLDFRRGIVYGRKI